MKRRTFLKWSGCASLVGLVQPTQILAGKMPLQYHAVLSGETLHGIAQMYGVTASELQQLNGLRSPIIHPGDRLLIPSTNPFVPEKKVAEKPLSFQPQGLKEWGYIVIHHSATRSGSAKAFDQYHRKRGMENGLAYHFVIGNGHGTDDGSIEIGDRWIKQLHGGHVKSDFYNQHSIGICLVGNFERHHPTRKQIASLTKLMRYLKHDLLDGKPEIYGHRELKTEQTLCPGRYFPLHQVCRSVR